MSRKREARHWCELCRGTLFVPSDEEPTERVDPDGRTILYRPPMKRCPGMAALAGKAGRKAESGPVMDRMRRAAGEREEEVG